MKKAGMGSNRFIVPLLIASTCLLLSCGCSGGTSGSAPCPGSYQPYFQYSPVGVNNISLHENLYQGTSIDVTANTITGAANSITFNVDFDSTKMQYDEYLTGTFFEQNGGQTTYSVNLDPANNNKLIITISGPGTGAGVTGSGVIVTLNFTYIASGAANVGFSSYHLLASNGQEITVNNWIGVTIDISTPVCA